MREGAIIRGAGHLPAWARGFVAYFCVVFVWEQRVGEQPLAGVTVLDFGQIYNGPYAGYLLAMSGARVIKVESPLGEGLRGATGSESFPFTMLNGLKETITINLKSEAGRELVVGMAKRADVLLENFRPGTMDKFGVGADALLKANPRLVYAASTGYGSSGPHRDYLAMDITVQAMSGVVSITGNDGEPPLKSGPALCDMLGGIHLYATIVSALYRREQTGKGAVIDVAMQDSVLPTLASALGAYYRFGAPTHRARAIGTRPSASRRTTSIRAPTAMWRSSACGTGTGASSPSSWAAGNSWTTPGSGTRRPAPSTWKKPMPRSRSGHRA